MSNLGDTLRERRAKLGVSITQAEKATRIRGAMLRALEDGDWDKLPNPGYVRGYISSYARFLELDAPPLLAMYKAETGSARYGRLNAPTEAVARTGEQHALPLRSAIAAVLVIALVSLSIWGVTRLWKGPEPTPPVPAPVTTPATTSPGAGESPLASDTPEAKSQPTVPTKNQPFTLEIRIANGGASWIEVKVDGNNAYAGTMTSGQSKKFEVAKQAVVNVGRPSVTAVLRDGKSVKIPPSDGTSTLTLKATSND